MHSTPEEHWVAADGAIGLHAFGAYVQHFEVTAGSAEKWSTQYLMTGR